MTVKTILEMLAFQKFQKMQEKQLEKHFREPIKTNDNTKLWVKLREIKFKDL